jgi:hypothetical protein
MLGLIRYKHQWVAYVHGPSCCGFSRQNEHILTWAFSAVWLDYTRPQARDEQF